MPLTAENRALARMVLEGVSLTRAARKYGKSRGRAWQVVRQFCLEQMLNHERTDKDGKIKDLNGLRKAWQTWTLV